MRQQTALSICFMSRGLFQLIDALWLMNLDKRSRTYKTRICSGFFVPADKQLRLADFAEAGAGMVKKPFDLLKGWSGEGN